MDGEHRKKSLLPTVFLLLLVVVGGILRLAAASGDLWLDEIWSLKLSGNVTNPLDILLNLHSDNNHPLNTLYMFLVSDGRSFYLYRLPSVIFGVLSLLLSQIIVAARPVAERFFLSWLLSFSYLLILYSSEARGYAAMIFAVLLGLWSLERFIAQGGRAILLVYWGSAIAGILAHYSFLQFYLAAFLYSAVRLQPHRFKSNFFLLHLIPLTAFAALYWVQIRFIDAGTGNIRSLIEVVLEGVSVAFGGPEISPLEVESGAWTVLGVILLTVVVVVELFMEKRSGDKRWLFLALVIFAAPMIAVIIFQPRVLFARYLLIPTLFSYFAAAAFLARVWQSTCLGKGIALLLAGLFLWGNIFYIEQLLQYGRGRYSEAIMLLLEASPTEEILVSGDQHFRNRTVIDFYAARIPGGERIRYLETGDPGNAEWFFAHSQDGNLRPESTVVHQGRQFELIFQLGSAAQSGWRWFLYRQTF